VTRRVEERDPAAVDVDLVGADVLCDPARLALDDARLADRVEERRLAVVDVAHDRHHRRPRPQHLLRVLEDLGLRLLVGGVLDRHLAAELGSDHPDLLVGQRLRRRPHLAEPHQDLDQVRHRDAERLREVADADTRLDGNRTGRRRGGLLPALAALAVLLVARLALVARVGARRLVVDHDAAAAAAGASAARAERTIRSVSSVGHAFPSV
jgi:hypothetical protein